MTISLSKSIIHNLMWCSADDNIVDVRDVITGEEIPFKKYNGKYVVRVESHRAILEADYFIKMIEQAE